MFSYIKFIAIAIVAIVIALGLYYISNMQANLAIAKENQLKLENSIKEQQKAIEVMKADAQAQQKISNEMQALNKKQQADMYALQKKLDNNRLANMAKAKPEALEEKVNRGSLNAIRCIEIASGAPLNEKEKGAKDAKSFNNECQNYWTGTSSSTK